MTTIVKIVAIISKGPSSKDSLDLFERTEEKKPKLI